MRLIGMRFAALFCVFNLIPGEFQGAQAQTLSITTEEMPPFNMSVDGKIVGIATDRLTKALERSRITYKISVYPWLRAYDMALKEVNTCVYSTNRTEDREPWFKWVGPLAEDGWVILAMAQSRILATSLEDLKGHRIGVGKGDALSVFLHERGLILDEVVHPSVPANELNLKKLQSGRIDFWAAGRITAAYTAAQLGIADIKQIFTLRDTSLYLACNQSVPDDVIDRLNAEIESNPENRDARLVNNSN